MIFFQLSMRFIILFFFENINWKSYFKGKCRIWINNEEGCHNGSNKTSHERENYEDFLDFSVVELLCGLFHDKECRKRCCIIHSERIKNGRIVHVIGRQMLHFFKRENWVICLNFNTFEVKIIFSPKLITEDVIRPILKIVFKVLWLIGIDNCISREESKIIPLSILHEEVLKILRRPTRPIYIRIITARVKCNWYLVINFGAIPSL